MGFLKQTGTEFKNILRVKFLLIFGILILAASIALPIITAISANSDENNNGGGGVIYSSSARAYAYKDIYYPGGQGDPITINGVTIMPDNPYYYNLQDLQRQQTDVDSTWFPTTGDKALDIWLRMVDQQINYFAELASYITTYEDYRVDLGWNQQPLYDKFIYENIDQEDPAALKEAMQMFVYMEDEAYNKKYVSITPEERLAALDAAESDIEALFDVVKNDNFPKYIDLKIQQENGNIKSMEEQIEIFEQNIIDHPDQEESLNMQIEDLKKQINLVKENNIPMLEYRLAHDIRPMADVWQNKALDDITNNRNNIMYTTKMTEEQFNQDPWTAKQYGTYARYIASVDAQIARYNNIIIIAQNCLDADQPDMKYVPNGSRTITVQFLEFSTLVALFAIMVGGWLMASEFQMGTIRLLMIRPKTRMKILMSKFLAGLLLALFIYVAGTVLNFVTNGICFGFGDYAFPNFTATGSVSFMSFFIPKAIACIVPIVFAYSVAYMLSVLVKNIAVAIAVPIVCFVASVIGMSALAYTSMADTLAYTPIPYLQIAQFFRPEIDWAMTPVQQMMQNGVPVSLTYGIIMLLAISAVCIGVFMLVFRKRDIAN